MYADFIRQVRISRGLSQAVLAEISGIAQPNISALENGRHVPTLDVLNRIVVACGYQLVAHGGSSEVRCPLPKAGWFPFEDVPQHLSDDPEGLGPPVPPGTSPEERGEILAELLDLADALR